ncbi:Zinc finger C2H2 domain containing protein [Gracilaria domingensis]|nr:Zinc finger C2H2 domain containing protein [Gracilaria domingensis]
MPPKTKQSRRQQTQTLCKICNIWIADNKAQRDQHESGAKHIANRQRLLREIADRNEKERAQARREGRRIAGGNDSLAVQHMMEIAMKATQGEIKESEIVEDNRQERVAISGQEVDENGYPLPANTAFQWTTVAEEDWCSLRNEHEEERIVSDFDQEEEHEEKDVAVFAEKRGKPSLKRELESDETIVAPNEDSEERSAALATFKKRKAASGRKRRRKL